MLYQDNLDISPIEETILFLILQNKGFLNHLTIEEFNNLYLPYIRTLLGNNFIYLSYLLVLVKNKQDKRSENLIDCCVDYLISKMQNKNQIYKFSILFLLSSIYIFNFQNRIFNFAFSKQIWMISLSYSFFIFKIDIE